MDHQRGIFGANTFRGIRNMGQHDHGGTSPYQTSTMVRDTNMLQAVYLKESGEKREREAGSERERERGRES